MPSYAFSEAQTDAIFSRGENLLVAAGAGSGKTSVLVERIIQWLLSGGTADALLALTFTNAAAADMRLKIGNALAKAIAAQPDHAHLRRQAALLPQASISTIHSFCLDLLRQHGYRIGLAPSFRVANQLEVRLLQDEVLDDLLEQEYARPESLLPALADAYGGSRNDRGLVELIDAIYAFAQSRPDPELWLDACLDGYAEKASIDDYPFADFLCAHLKTALANANQLLCQADQLAELVPVAWQTQLAEELQAVRAVVDAPHRLSTLLPALAKLSFASLRGRSAGEQTLAEAAAKEQFKQLRSTASKEIKQLQQRYARTDAETQIAELQRLHPLVQALIDLLHRYAAALSAEKRKKGLVDFSDMEHLALQILRVPEVQAELQARFATVLIDEYQDINEVQEAIIGQISRGDNLFVVGDVKQSIYRFRLAEPSLFLHKYNHYGKGLGGRRIDLNRNYRSDQNILQAVNSLFSQLMVGGATEICYDDVAALKPGREVQGQPVELALIDLDQQPEAEPALSALAAEGRFIANRIKELQAEGYAYRDMVILQRSPRRREPVILAALAEAGIPAVADNEENYHESPEVTLMLSLLQLVDNPQQDIPLAAALRSPVFAFSAEELLQIRLLQPEQPFHQALAEAGLLQDALGEKVRQFTDTLAGWRKAAGQHRITELLRQIYQDSGIYYLVSAAPEAARKKANLDQLYAQAFQYEQSGYAGLFRFVRLLEEGKARAVSAGNSKLRAENEDVVRLMSIHKSKGLEFPVVFLAGLNGLFNEEDERADIIAHRSLGLGVRVADRSRRMKYAPLSHLAVAAKLHEEALAEEMRVLYVAMTRPRERLILCAALRKLPQAVEAWAAATAAGEQLPARVLAAARKPLDWLGPALIRHPDAAALRELAATPCAVWADESRYSIALFTAESLHNPTLAEPIAAAAEEEADPALTQQIEQALSYQYPYAKACHFPAKWSVSDFSRHAFLPEEDAVPMLFAAEHKLPDFSRPLAEAGAMASADEDAAAARGSAYHKVMELLDLSAVQAAQIQAQISRMQQQGYLSELQAAAVSSQRIAAFLQTPLGQKLCRAQCCYREIPFTLLKELPEVGEVLLQGTIDAVFCDDQGWHLLDYKTGGYGQSEQALLQRYQAQLDCYCEAMQRIWQQPLKTAHLCLLDLGRNIAVPIANASTTDAER